jgi:hypothetical protein
MILVTEESLVCNVLPVMKTAGSKSVLVRYEVTRLAKYDRYSRYLPPPYHMKMRVPWFLKWTRRTSSAHSILARVPAGNVTGNHLP